MTAATVPAVLAWLSINWIEKTTVHDGGYNIVAVDDENIIGLRPRNFNRDAKMTVRPFILFTVDSDLSGISAFETNRMT
jgi:hypothetical protein